MSQFCQILQTVCDGSSYLKMNLNININMITSRLNFISNMNYSIKCVLKLFLTLIVIFKMTKTITHSLPDIFISRNLYWIQLEPFRRQNFCQFEDNMGHCLP